MRWYASRRFALRFDRMRQYDGGVAAALERIDEIKDLRGAEVVELGAGTGVVTAEIARRAGRVRAFDRSRFMLEVAAAKLRRLGLANCELRLADHRSIPLPDRCADLVVAAWTLAAVVYDASPHDWGAELDRVVAEMLRIARFDGAIVILCPVDPGPRNYLQRLETRHAFRRSLFASRWTFPSRAAARRTLRFFFNERTGAAYRDRGRGDFVSRGVVCWRYARPPGARELEEWRSGRSC